MTSLTTSICKVMGMKCLHLNQLGNAMTWALRSQDSTFTTFLADKLLNLYCESGTFSSGDLLDHLGKAYRYYKVVFIHFVLTVLIIILEALIDPED